MKPFKKATYRIDQRAGIKADLMEKFNMSEDQAEAQLNASITGQVYLNDTYQVLVREAQTPEWGSEMFWLSIKRIDKEPIHDWRDLQEIKNMLVGEENEAVELFPAESRRVDTANQYHLWVLKDFKVRFPFGFTGERVVTDSQSVGGSKQRKLP